MEGKIELLMEEAGCTREQAVQALVASNGDVEEAIKAVARLLRHIVVVKGKFHNPEANQFGLLMLAVNVKTREVLRSRAVVSFNPAVYEADLEKDWFDFERHLFSCRLWEGSLQTESLEVERALSERFGSLEDDALRSLGGDEAPAPTADVSAALKVVLGTTARLKLKKDVIDVGRFKSLEAAPSRSNSRAKAPAKAAEDPLVLKISLEQDPVGIAASELRAGDMVSARIVDGRDIAQYLAKLFGAFSETGPVPVLAPVEAVESGPEGLLARVRFAAGVCGDAVVPIDSRLKVVRVVVRNRESHSWWRRFFKT